MTLTEKQGGSDLRATQTTARAATSRRGPGEPYVVDGHKSPCRRASSSVTRPPLCPKLSVQHGSMMMALPSMADRPPALISGRSLSAPG
jgi:hypothetical protein